jgi:hypothetical protein
MPRLYRPRSEFTNRTIHNVTFTLGEDLHIDRAQQLQAAARD